MNKENKEMTKEFIDPPMEVEVARIEKVADYYKRTSETMLVFASVLAVASCFLPQYAQDIIDILPFAAGGGLINGVFYKYNDIKAIKIKEKNKVK